MTTFLEEQEGPSHPQAFPSFFTRRCRKGVDPISYGSSKFIAIDEQPNDQIVHVLRLGKTDSAAHQPFDPGPQIDVFALDFLRVFLANPMLFGVNVPLVRSPPIRVIARDAKRLQQRLQLEKNGILSASKDIG
jgi:hypothetical protein